MKIQKIIFMLLLGFLSINGFAQKNVVQDRKDLQELLNKRKEKFDSYTASLEKRSGIFGNKTKKDILISNEVLVNIVLTDNRIINTLNRVIDFRNFETSNTKFDAAVQNQNYDNLLHATDTLSKQVSVLTILNKNYKNKAIKFEWLFYAAIALIIWMLITRWRKKIHIQQ
ncbi:MAG: hypothetical protein ABIT08_04740 [Bacteroidia bacterium]